MMLCLLRFHTAVQIDIRQYLEVCSLHFIEYLQQPLRDCLNDRHGHGIPSHSVQSPVPEVSGGELGKLLVRESLQPPVFERGQTSDSAADPDAVPVLRGQREHRFANFLYPSPLLSDGCTVGVQDGLNRFCEKYPLRRVCGQRLRNLISHSPAAVVVSQIRNVDPIPMPRQPEARFGSRLDGQYDFQLYQICNAFLIASMLQISWVCVSESQYLSGTSVSKKSDKKHSFPILGDKIICAVKAAPRNLRLAHSLA